MTTRPPRIGCLGVGWIGRHRMQAVASGHHGQIVALADPDEQARAAALAMVPGAAPCSDLDDLLDRDLDGLMIATPNALHAEQCITALQRGVAVFCQKPLARSADETRAVIAAARDAGRLLHVDLSYRHVHGVPQLRQLVQAGELGRVFRVELMFHNAYGPDKDWFHDVRRSGGGCLIDLGTHLVDLAAWTLDFPPLEVIHRALYRGGAPLLDPDGVEDFATAELRSGDHVSLSIATSWRLHAGREACIEARFFGTEGGAALTNVAGSFYDFRVERHRGTTTEVLAEPPDAWGGRAAIAWAERLREDASFDPELESLVGTARILDDIYDRPRRRSTPDQSPRNHALHCRSVSTR